MEKINTPPELPNCKLINTLIEKSNSKIDYEFNYISELDEIRKRVSIEVSQINLLFPEYTPHDEKYHLKRLFYVADQLLGNDLIENMNVTELFLLAVSLYAHDWGMAISEEEKSYILSGCEGTLDSKYVLLDDENVRIRQFCKTKNTDITKIELSDWQEYVRQTHAFRSGKRIKTYFDPISLGIADFSSRICEGHWLDFEIIDDYTSYPTDAAIHRDIVNIKALSIYVRLIDLLDLGEDRTPYLLWKFVAPRNKFSKIEWAKHRALQPVSFPQYQLARFIQVDGSTEDQNVYMSIMDLKRYVDDQFRQCSDILNRINHDYHKLNISHIDWRIAARGFDPISIQFEFDRNRMFEILSDDIYQGNPYVFVRELLQNAIDAIEMRTEILKRKGLTFIPKINFNVIEDDQFFIVHVSDNGIGMDQYIIRNYLAVAGKSYYRSTDFQNEGLSMDPISRFGIGVLSCFMMAEYIEIETYKDPNTTQKHEKLKISIPSKENYFKIKQNTDISEIGTTFKVFVIKDKLPKLKKSGDTIRFNITDYLKKIAGFVKFQISIFENGNHLIINSPNELTEPDFGFHSIDYKFPFDRAILPHSLGVVNEYFFENTFHLKRDLGLAKYDGCITYLLPKSNSIDIISADLSYPCLTFKIIDYERDLAGEKSIQWNPRWGTYSRYSSDEEDSTFDGVPYKVFLDGIMLERIPFPSMDIIDPEIKKLYDTRFLNDTFNTQQIWVNIPKSVDMKIDLARSNIKSNERWDKPIWDSFIEYLKKTKLKEIESEKQNVRLLSIAKLVTFYNLPIEVVLESVIADIKFPIPFSTDGGNLIFKDFDRVKLDTIKLAPYEFEDHYYSLIESHYVSFKKYSGVLKLWKGGTSMPNFKHISYFENVPVSIKNIGKLIKSFVNRHYFLESIELISSPLGDQFPLVQEILKIKPLVGESLNLESIVLLSFEDLDASSFDFIYKLFKKEFNGFPRLVKFPESYESKFAFSFKYINTNNDTVKLLVKLCLSLLKAKKNNSQPREIVGKLVEMVSSLRIISFNYSELQISIEKINKEFEQLFFEAKKCNLIQYDGVYNSKITLDDFVNNSIVKNIKKKSFSLHIEQKKYLRGKRLWGTPLKNKRI